jgi:putative endonuclease
LAKQYFVYIMASQSRVIYTGLSSKLKERVFEHKQHVYPGFTSRYNATTLVFYESYDAVQQAINREKEIKGWRRSKKIALIDSINPKWNDLSVGWYEPEIGIRPRQQK